MDERRQSSLLPALTLLLQPDSPLLLQFPAQLLSLVALRTREEAWQGWQSTYQALHVRGELITLLAYSLKPRLVGSRGCLQLAQRLLL